MPEGDTIWRAATVLRDRLAGARVEDARPERLAPLRGSSLRSVDPVGKHLVMRFDNGLALHTHMRMTGSWHLYRRGAPWRRSESAARAILDFPEWVAVLFSAPVVELVREDRVPVGHLGEDILAPGFDVTAAVERARRLAPPTVGELLLDQRVSAGIGNVYKCESLWELRLDPWTDPARLSDEQLLGLVGKAREMMLGNLRGDFSRRFATAGGLRRAAVHGRGGRPCPRCGTHIRVKAQGAQARLTYYCPVCQGASTPS